MTTDLVRPTDPFDSQARGAAPRTSFGSQARSGPASTSGQARDITLADHEQAAGALAHVLGTGDLYQLSNEQRVAHYLGICRRRGLNPLARPYQWIEFKDGDNPPVLTLYLKVSGAAEVLRNNHVTVSYPTREIVGELFKVEAHGVCPDGREGWATKYVPLTGQYGKLTGRRLANAFMTAESGAMRRLAIAMFGGGDEIDGDVVNARTVYVDGTGAVLDHPSEQERYLAEHPEAARAIGEPTFESTAAADPDASAAYDRDLGDAADSAPRTEEVAPRRRAGPAASLKPHSTPASPSLRASSDDVTRWLGAWHAGVKGTYLEDEGERHKFFRQWTSQYDEGIRTESSRTFFEHCTERQAADVLAHMRAIVADEKAQQLAESATNAPFDSSPAGFRSGQAEEPF